MTRPPLQRPKDDRILAGVCSGLATHLGLPVRAVRVGMLVLAALGGAGGLLYLWLWGTVPRVGETEGIVPLRRALTRPQAGAPAAERPPGERAAPTKRESDGSLGRPPQAQASHAGPTTPRAKGAREPAARARWPIAELLLGIGLLVAGTGLVLERLGVSLELDRILPALAVLVGVGLTWWQVADRDRPDRNQVPRVLGALALVAVGVLMFFVTAREPSAWTVIAAAFAVLAGVALAVAPWLLRLNRELIAERAAREREAERSEIAAHLHDSVLQTLAAIQQRSQPGSEVARLARRQERDLREWLFRSADGASPLAREAAEAELREHAAALEAEHAVRFEVVAVGARRAVPEAIVAAAREAMLNAARHAGGEVTVYVEVAPERVSIDVTDRGAGLDLDRLPEGRMGIRESILGRMQRAGGTAAIVPGPGGAGTSVRLSMPLAEPEGAGSASHGEKENGAGSTPAPSDEEEESPDD